MRARQLERVAPGDGPSKAPIVAADCGVPSTTRCAGG